MKSCSVDTFVFEDVKYEIRVEKDQSGFKVRVFCGNQPANGYAYHVSFEINDELYCRQNMRAIDHLKDLAKHDVLNRVWEKWVEESATTSNS